MPDAIPWAHPFRRRCHARTLDEYGYARCDLQRDHKDDHRAERGMYDLVWSAHNWTEEHEYWLRAPSPHNHRAALERIAATPCGIPGHAVAVGCDAARIARRALGEGDR